MTKHTPGPWSVYDSGEHGATYGIDGHHGEAVVWYGEDSFSGIRKLANARLIAAAPELYELVKEYQQSVVIRKNMAAADNDTLLVGAFLDQLEKINAVLAKVEGDDA